MICQRSTRDHQGTRRPGGHPHLGQLPRLTDDCSLIKEQRSRRDDSAGPIAVAAGERERSRTTIESQTAGAGNWASHRQIPHAPRAATERHREAASTGHHRHRDRVGQRRSALRRFGNYRTATRDLDRTARKRERNQIARGRSGQGQTAGSSGVVEKTTRTVQLAEWGGRSSCLAVQDVIPAELKVFDELICLRVKIEQDC